MPGILVRGLTAATVARLKRQARLRGRSLQAEAKAILEQAAPPNATSTRKLVMEIRRHFRGRRFSDSTALIREDRDR